MATYGLPTTVEEIMTPDVITTDVRRTVLDAARVMKERGVGCLVVMSKGEIAGIITERDIVIKVVATGLDPRMVRIEDFMSKPVITISPEATIAEASKIMATNGIRRLPVIKDGKLVGIVTERDVVHYSWAVLPPRR